MRYQFQVDGRAAGPVRNDWAIAAQDAVAAGYAMWTHADSIQVDDQASIARIAEARELEPVDVR